MMIRNILKKLDQFDPITRFRLINSFITAIGMNLFWPVLTDLKGEYLVAWVISFFMILETLMVKTNRWFIEKFTMQQIFRMSVIAHLGFTITALTYFWISPEFMVWADMIMGIIDVTVFSAFSIVLNNYITDNYPKSMNEFQIIRNSTWADGIIIGLSIVTVVTFSWGNAVAIGFFIFFNTCFTLWLLSHWNFIENNLVKVKK